MASFESALLNYRQELGRKGPNHAELLSDSLLKGTQLPTSKQIEEYLLLSRKEEEDAEKETELKKDEFSNNVSNLLNHLRRREDDLARVPEEIGALEDALAELSSEFESRNDVHPNTTSTSTSLLNTLSQQQSMLKDLEAIQNYLSILAKAEDLKLESIKAEKDRKVGGDSLLHFTELATFSKKVNNLSNNSSLKNLKAVSFVNSQKAQSFNALVKLRQERLDLALKEAGWPPPPPELRIENQSSNSNESFENILSKSNEVKQAWRELMMLQRKSEKAGVLRMASSKIVSQDDIFENEGETKVEILHSPGSQSYQPILAVECLLKPLLLRFYHHFDSSRPTNRLDKPEWYLNHMLSILRSNISLFDPVKGVVALLCNNVSKSRNQLRYDLSAELLHGILRPLSLKLESSISLLLQNPQLLSHTIMQAVQFDQDIRTMLMPIMATSLPIYLADSLLSKENVFEAWVESERAFASDRLNEELESGSAWLIGDEDGVESEVTEGSWAAMAQGSSMMMKVQTSDEDDSNDESIRMKTTRSARAVIALIDGLTVRYRYLPSISHQLPFLLVQLSVLQGYAQRLERSLDAFESLSSAFSRAIPGAISGGGGGTGEGQGVSGGEADMVRGLRGLGRLLKACLSALYVSAHLSLLSSQSFFLMMGTSLAATREGHKLMGDFRKWEGDEEERELDHASLGDLVRRGWRSGGRIASGMRPLGSNAMGQSADNVEAGKQSQPSSITNEVPVDVWEKSRNRFGTLAERALRAIEKMIISEVLDGIRTYSQRDWDEEAVNEQDGEGEEGVQIDTMFDIPTPSLLSSLSTLSTLLSHMLPSLPLFQANGVYRSIADGISSSIVDRVVFSGGAHRFNVLGAKRFEKDVLHGWMGVVNDISSKFTTGGEEVLTSLTNPMGSRPQASWSYLLDTAKLISLTDEDDDPSLRESGKPTLQQACRAAFEPTMAGPSWEEVVEMLNIDDRMQLRIAREILRRRIECPW